MVYKVTYAFSGQAVAYVEADDSEEAIDKAFGGDVLDERSFHDQQTILEIEERPNYYDNK